MAGIYLHIPFCRQACTYCNFHFSTSLKLKEEIIAGIRREIELTPFIKNGGKNIETIYFGGGTPGILDPEEIEILISAIHEKFIVSPTAEITLEANPDDISLEKLKAWKTVGVNRLSVGIQSFDDNELSWMNRAHDSAKASECLELIEAAGFTNYTADLIYGSTLQTKEILEANLEKMISHKIPHLSCYALTVEEGTILKKKIELHKEQDVNEDKQAAHFKIVLQKLEEAGYEQYEISNFALPGYRSRHNSNYWSGVPYYGFGPSAHSFDGADRRSWNIANNAFYIQSLQKDILPQEHENLTHAQMQNEMIMLGLRKAEGINLDIMEKRFGTEAVENVVKKAEHFVKGRLINVGDNHLRLTPEGKFLADGIAADLFCD